MAGRKKNSLGCSPVLGAPGTTPVRPVHVHAVTWFPQPRPGKKEKKIHTHTHGITIAKKWEKAKNDMYQASQIG